MEAKSLQNDFHIAIAVASEIYLPKYFNMSLFVDSISFVNLKTLKPR